MRLPGHVYAGNDPDGFSQRDDVIRFHCRLRRAHSSAHTVWRQRQRCAPDRRRALACAGGTHVRSGPQCRRRYRTIPDPDIAAVCRPIARCHFSGHREPLHASVRASSPGGVLVVGSGASGCQITEDLLLDGRSVYYSLRGHRRMARRYRERDGGEWGEEMGATNRTSDMVPPGFRTPLITGYKGGKTVDLHEMAQRGVTMLGSLQDIQGGRIFFATDLNQEPRSRR